MTIENKPTLDECISDTRKNGLSTMFAALVAEMIIDTDFESATQVYTKSALDQHKNRKIDLANRIQRFLEIHHYRSVKSTSSFITQFTQSSVNEQFITGPIVSFNDPRLPKRNHISYSPNIRNGNDNWFFQ